MVVTGGVLAEEANLKQWFDAGAMAVGMGSALIRRDWVNSGKYDRIAELVALVLGWIARYKSSS
jgi:2-dehydro-3-deoxyphosphogluconate aldolase/(4S)-4-hydroxy-2-oxoglutarate aldolase